ncbi:MAG: hypothetical protein IJ099_00750 [Alphaproteobacteria bacterium]|nr:hypothetical protein [Alphaproteobacteria bacterium]
MKKLLLLVAVVAMCFLVTSCEKKEAVKLGDCELTEANGKFGLKYEGQTLLYPEFERITLEAGMYMAVKDGETTVLEGTSHSQLLTDKIESIVPAEQKGFYYIKAANNRNYLFKGTSTWGPFEEIILQDNYTFLRTDGKWGVASVAPRIGLAPRNYTKVYIVKNKSTFAVLVYDGKTWQMFDDKGVIDGAQYEISAKELNRQMKKAKFPEISVGVVEVDWKL